MFNSKYMLCWTGFKKAAYIKLQDKVGVLSTSQVKPRTGNLFKHLPPLQSQHTAVCAMTVCPMELTRICEPGLMPCFLMHRSAATGRKNTPQKPCNSATKHGHWLVDHEKFIPGSSLPSHLL